MADALNQVNPIPRDGHNEPNPGHNQPDPNLGDRHNQPSQPNPNPSLEAEAEAAMIKYLNWTPLHVFASCGDIENVRALIQMRPDRCLVRDRDGANPLHVAAMRGKVEVLDEFYNANPYAARARVGSAERETILHLCVKYDQLLFLKKLLEKYFKGKEFVNAKDNDGNTILHLAVADQRKEVIKYIISQTEIDVNAVNASNQTAMDILLDGREKGSTPDKYIKALLQTKDARREFFALINFARVAERRNGIMVAAVLMATLAFQVGVVPPGGVWQDDRDGHRSGEAVMASTYPLSYKLFLFYVIVSFSASILTVVFILVDMVVPTRKFLSLTLITLYVTIASLAATFAISLSMVSFQMPLYWPAFAKTKMIILQSLLALAAVILVSMYLLICRKKKRTRRAVERFTRLGRPNQA